MIYVFWIAFAWLAYVYLGYAVLLLVLGIWKSVAPNLDHRYHPAVSVLLSARNEEKDIAWKLKQMLTWDFPADKLQILVASDASTDGTDTIITSFHDPRVVYVRMKSQVGKNSALNYLAKLATGDILFFTDANSNVPVECLERLVRYFADPRVGCVTGVERVLPDDADPALSLGTTTYLDYESLLNRLESKLGSVLVCDGSIFCVRRALFRKLSPELANDLELPLRIASAGHWVLYDRHARSLERCTSSPREEFRRRRRICAQGLLGFWRLRSTLHGIRLWQIVSRKLLRWFTLLPFLAVCASSIFMIKRNAAYQLVAVSAAVPWVLALLGCSSFLRQSPVGRVVGPAFHFLLALVAAFMGTIDACTGRQYSVWTIAQVSRGPASSFQMNPSNAPKAL